MDNLIPRATLSDLALPGEPSNDRGFTDQVGAKYRVRIVQVEDAGASTVSVYSRAYDITITRLDDNLAVAKNSDGSVDIVAQTRWSIDEQSFQLEAPADALRTLVEQLVYRAAKTVAAKSELDSVMSGWQAK